MNKHEKYLADAAKYGYMDFASRVMYAVGWRNVFVANNPRKCCTKTMIEDELIQVYSLERIDAHDITNHIESMNL
jgi:hypothetical protein